MTREEALELAWAYVSKERIQVSSFCDIRYVEMPPLDPGCPPEMLETYYSVKARFRNHWVISFRKVLLTGVTECPETEMVCVYDDGGVSLSPSL